MNLSFQINCETQEQFIEHWSLKYRDPNEEKYENNIGKPMTEKSRQELFEWKNGGIISKRKQESIVENYPLIFLGDKEKRYLSHKEGGGAIWNIFYLHCLEPDKYLIFDQHTYRAMKYIQTGKIIEISNSDKEKYRIYKDQYIPFHNLFRYEHDRKVDKALFAFGQFLKKVNKYL